MKWRRFLGLLEVVAAAIAILLTVEACIGPVPRFTQIVVPATTLLWVANSALYRRQADKAQVRARWERFWRHHEDVIPQGKPPIPGVVFPPGDHTG